MTMFAKFKRIIFLIGSKCEYIGWFILLGWVSVMFFGTISRYCFRSPFIFQTDLVSIGLIVFCSLCFPAVFLSGEHIRVELFMRFLPKKIQKIFYIFAEVLLLLFSILIAYSTLEMISHAIEVDSRLEVSDISAIPFIICIPIGFCLFAVVILIDIFDRVMKDQL